MHCHLCPQGTRKAMKKAKVMMLRAQETTGHQKEEPAYVACGCQSPLPPAAVCSDSSLPSLSSIMAGFDEKEKDEVRRVLPTPVKVQVKNTFIQVDVGSSPKGASDPPLNSAPGDFFRRCFQTRQTLEVGQSTPASAPMSAPSPNVEAQGPVQGSVHFDETVPELFPADADSGKGNGMTGVQAHALGQCIPCAYFWYKKDGCRLGEECKFCHLCQKGEIKKRKKHRIQHLKAVGAFIPGFAKLQQEM